MLLLAGLRVCQPIRIERCELSAAAGKPESWELARQSGQNMTPLLPATPGITYTTVLLVAARCFIRLHFSLRGLPEDLRALSLTLASTALIMAQMCCPMVRCEACGAEEPLPHEDYPRAERIKVCGPYTGSVNMC